MAAKPETFNLEAAVFLRELKSFNVDGKKIDSETLELWKKIQNAGDKLLQKTKSCEAKPNIAKNFIDRLNDENFQLRHYFICCLCYEQVPLCQSDFDAHLRKKSHQENAAQHPKSKVQMNDASHSSNESSSSTTDEEFEVENCHDLSARDQNENQIPSDDTAALEQLLYSHSFTHKIMLQFEQMNLHSFGDQYADSARNFMISKEIGLCVENFGPSVGVDLVGSSFYGDEDVQYDLDFVIDATPTKMTATDFLSSFKKLLTSKFANRFHDFSQIPATRVMKERLAMVHTKTGKRIVVIINEPTILKSNKIISDFFEWDKISGPVAQFIRFWLISLNKFSSENGQQPIPFNTYILNVLVLFFFQMNFKMCTIDKLSVPNDAKANHYASMNDFELLDLSMTTIRKLFHFYGHSYKPRDHIISTSIGKWEMRQVEPGQKRFNTAQKRLRDGIKKNPENWKNCGMFVQDLVRPGVNITADISEEMASKFQRLCVVMHSSLEKQSKGMPYGCCH